MKKYISVLVAAALALSMTACGAQVGQTEVTEAASEKTAAFSVGFGKADFTPDQPVGLAGYGRTDLRISNGVISYLYAICVAITDAEGETVLLYSLDLGSPGYALKYLTDVSKATGVPEDHIVMAATHTHSAPDYGAKTPGSSAALLKLQKALIKAGEAAMADRKPAQMLGGSVQVTGMNFVRHYLCNDGTYYGDGFGSSASGLKAHATEADGQLQVVRFVREGGKDIYLTNFQCHPHQTGGSDKHDISSDVVGEYRTALEKDLGVEVIYFSGAGGNLNSHSRIPEEQATQDFKAWGRRLAEYVKKIEFRPLQTGSVQAVSGEFRGEVDHSTDQWAEICHELRTAWDQGQIDTKELKELGLTYGISLNSPYHAGAIYTRSTLGETEGFPIYAFAFGDVGFVAAPYEMFDTNGVCIKEHSPFAMTVIATQANGGNGYFPSDFTFTYGSYETDTTKYVQGTAEVLADQFVELLAQLKSE